jgi:hypothetical protein
MHRRQARSAEKRRRRRVSWQPSERVQAQSRQLRNQDGVIRQLDEHALCRRLAAATQSCACSWAVGACMHGDSHLHAYVHAWHFRLLTTAGANRGCMQLPRMLTLPSGMQ